ncbi:MAG: DUF1223 domain-containing protein [Gammaproteobacteria bacterium]|nr:DUF1223 domain-containing protein [Gammaproteobacteria bacterium]
MLKQQNILFYLASTLTFAQTLNVEFKSPPYQTTLIELYTSEGCSSCPPADRWLSQFKQHPQLWHEVFPLAFHVDYWDYLGWRDKFAQVQFSQRQRLHQKQGHLRSVYTPAFVINGKEWRGFFRKKRLDISNKTPVGELKLKINQNTLSAQFTPENVYTTLHLNYAIVAMNLSNSITDGENSGHILHHDFVVLQLVKINSKRAKSPYFWQTDFSLSKYKNYGNLAIIAWVTQSDSHEAIQTTGGRLH